MNYSKDDNMRKRKNSKSIKKKVKNKVSILIFRMFIAIFLIGAFAGGGALVGIYLGIIENAPKMEPLALRPSIYPSIIYYDDGTESDKLKGEENRKYVKLDKIPKNLRDAFVAIEDERFYTHDGVDYKGMARALVTVIKTQGKRQEGASTITQQLIKNNVRKMSSNTIITKVQEQYLAVEYEKVLIKEFGSKEAAKDHILELYMNSINMSYGLNGVQTASEFYFKKPVSELTLSESAVIAAITQNPAHNAPINGKERNRHRQELILKKMLELGMINQKEHDEALKDKVYERVSTKSEASKENNSIHSYYVDALIQQVVADLQEKYKIGQAESYNWIYNGGLSIYSNQDKEMQKIMDESFLNDDLYPKSGFEIDVQYDVSVRNKITGKISNYHKQGTVKKAEDIEALTASFDKELLGINDEVIARNPIPIPQPQAAMVITDFHNGHVKALTGGRGQKLANLSLNRAVDSERQPGSVFKVLASFAPSIDLGYNNAKTILVDAPFTYNKWSPKNWYGGYRGAVTLRTAIKNSMNVVTVKNMVATGVEESYKYLKNFGFTTLVDGELINGVYKTDIGAATSLGGITRGVTQIELADAYGAIANEGEYNRHTLYSKIIDNEGKIILENEYKPRRVLKKQTADTLTDIMQDVINSGTGTKAKFRTIKMPISGKTGTTSDTKDLMFTAYTPYYVASIWLGYDKPKPMREDRGYHMLLWRDVMEKIHENLPLKEFEKAGVAPVVKKICTVSGKLAVSGLCERDPRKNIVVPEELYQGSKPTEYCDVHIAARVCTISGKKANRYCPGDVVRTYVGVAKWDSSTKLEKYEIPARWINGAVCDVHKEGDLSVEPELTPDLSPVTPNPTKAPTRQTEQPIIITPSSAPAPAQTLPPEVPTYTPQPFSPPPEEDFLTPDLPTIDDVEQVDNFQF